MIFHSNHPLKSIFSLLSICFLGVLLATFQTELAQAFDFKNPLEPTSGFGVSSFSQWFGNLLVSIQGIVGWLAVIMIIVGGMTYMTSGGSQTQASKGKAILTAALIGFAVAVAAPSLLREVKDLAATGAGGGAGSGVISSAKTIQAIVTDLLSFMLTLIGIASVVSFATGGVLFITAAGDPSKTEKGKQIVVYSIIAICISGASLTILKQVLAILSA